MSPEEVYSREKTQKTQKRDLGFGRPRTAVSDYIELTNAFNQGRVRAVLSSGQAVVFHRLALMSKDGDWILREDQEAVEFVLNVLANRDAVYRFGAPMDLRWLRHGWSSHLQFRRDGLRLRTDFVTRPPRLSEGQLVHMWAEQERKRPAVLDIARLIEIKKTNREKDYAVIGELARRLTDPIEQALCSRSARDLLDLATKFPEAVARARRMRPVLDSIDLGREALESALDQERRVLMKTNEERLARYERAARAWLELWPQLSRQVAQLPLLEAHERIVHAAEQVLPYSPET